MGNGLKKSDKPKCYPATQVFAPLDLAKIAQSPNWPKGLKIVQNVYIDYKMANPPQMTKHPGLLKFWPTNISVNIMLFEFCTKSFHMLCFRARISFWDPE